MEAKKEIVNLLKAGYPLLSVKTQEPLRFATEAAEAAAEVGRRVIRWDSLTGAQEIGGAYNEEITAFQVCDSIRETPGAVWILFNFHFSINEPQVIQGIQNALPWCESKEGQVTLIIVSPGFSFPAELEREIRELSFTLPDRETLALTLDALTESAGLAVDDAEIKTQIIDNLLGLTVAEAKNAIAWAMVTDKALKPLTIGKVKGQMVSKSAGLTFSTFTESLDSLVGNDNLKKFTLNRFARRRSGLPFKGIILLGKPGNGKSHFAKALGASVGWRTVIFDLGRVFGGLVGESEENMDRALAVLDSIAPAICFIDEVEKALAGAGGGTGVNETTIRVAAKFLQWLQDHESEIFVVATCNDIKALAAASDGAFIRPGRWDGIFFIDNPDQTQAAGILDLYLQEFTGKALADYPEIPELRDYSGAEIRQVAIETAYNGGELGAAARFVKPMARTNKAALDELTKWAQGRTEPAHISTVDASAGNRAITM